MNGGAATSAIVVTRLRKEAGFAAFAIAAGVLLPSLEPRGVFPIAFAGCMLYGTLVGIAAALRQRSGRLREIELCEQSAPLFGRELARARALVPCTILSLVVFAYWIAATIHSWAQVAAALLTLTALNAVAVIALGATLRRGVLAATYVLFAVAIGLTALIARDFESASATLAVTGVYALTAFVALRQYGEALARYDPIEC